MSEALYIPTKPKIAAESRVFVIDFTDHSELEAGETISSPAATSSPSGLTIGTPTVTSADVTEDGVTITDLSLVGGSAANVRVNATNTTGSPAQLCGFIDFNGDGVRDFNNFSALMASGRITLADVDGDLAVDDIVIDTSLSETSGFQIALIGDFAMSDITQGWFSI